MGTFRPVEYPCLDDGTHVFVPQYFPEDGGYTSYIISPAFVNYFECADTCNPSLESGQVVVNRLTPRANETNCDLIDRLCTYQKLGEGCILQDFFYTYPPEVVCAPHIYC